MGVRGAGGGEEGTGSSQYNCIEDNDDGGGGAYGGGFGADGRRWEGGVGGVEEPWEYLLYEFGAVVFG